MALVVPLASSASVIENILFKVRRGIALSRNASQANSNTGVMVDLPEKIDFEMTLLKTHQSSAFQRVVETTASEGGSESRATQSSESSLTGKVSTDSDGTASKEQSLELSSDQTNRKGQGNEQGAQISGDGSKGIEDSTSNENAKGNGNSQSNEQGKGNGINIDHEAENRCTYQDHKSNRYYDKFDTDTGKIEGISL